MIWGLGVPLFQEISIWINANGISKIFEDKKIRLPRNPGLRGWYLSDSRAQNREQRHATRPEGGHVSPWSCPTWKKNRHQSRSHLGELFGVWNWEPMWGVLPSICVLHYILSFHAMHNKLETRHSLIVLIIDCLYLYLLFTINYLIYHDLLLFIYLSSLSIKLSIYLSIYLPIYLSNLV